MNTVYYLRTHNGLDVLRIARDGLSLEENNFNHSEWNLESSILPAGTQDHIHSFCSAQGIPSLDWSAMAMRHF